MDKEIFTGEQEVIERYGDLKPCGAWGIANVQEDGTLKGIPGEGGTLYEETVKYKGADGKIKLGQDWTTGQ